MTGAVLIGGGGFAGEVAEIASLQGISIIGYVALEPSTLSLPYLGPVDTLASPSFGSSNVVIGIGAVDRASVLLRSKIINQVRGYGMVPLTVVSPHAVVSQGVQIGQGSFVAHAVVLSAGALIGSDCIINTSAVVGHGSVIGNGSIVAPCSFIAGGVKAGSKCLIGPRSIVLEGVALGEEVVVSFGSSVARDCASFSTVLPSLSKVVV
jgi:acetyltransferase EpsM